MIDDLFTRVALSFAAFLLLGAGLSVVSLSGDAATRQSIRDLAKGISHELDLIGRFDAHVAVHFGPDESASVRLPSMLGGHPYRIEIRTTDVRVIAHAAMAVEPLRIPVHPFLPTQHDYSIEELRDLDATSDLIIPSGEPFLSVRAAVLLEGTPVFLTFAHIP